MEVLIAVIALLFATVLVAAVGERTGLPWPALLTIVVALAIFLPGVPVVTIPAEIILPIFLPPLLWSLARHTSWGMIRSQLNVVFMMSVILVFLTTAALSATAMWLMPGISLAAAVVLAAAIAPPDPVAVEAVAGPAGIPKRITGTLQTEGLFNDAASIVTFNLAVAALVADNQIDFGHGLLKFLYAAAVAVVIGLIVGRLAALFVNSVPDSVIRTAFTWVLPFFIYIIAEEVEASGVIAIVIAAVEMSSRAPLTAEDRLSGSSFWSTVEMLFTGVAFGLIGMSVRDAIDAAGTVLWHAVGIGVALSVVAFLVRLLWMWVLCGINQKQKRTNVAPLRMQEVLLMAWSGMRGLVTLALVLSVPLGVTQYHHEFDVIALTVLMCTMVLPGLSLPWLVSKLDMESGPDPAGDRAKAELNKRAYAAARRSVQKHGPELAPEPFEIVQQWLDKLSQSHEEEDPETAEDRKQKFQQVRLAAADMQQIALAAASQELQRARCERKYNPADVDAVRADLDRLIVAGRRNALMSPREVYREAKK